jgi:hypothetical protein
MRTVKQLTAIVTRATKDLHLEIARKWGIPAGVITEATLGIGVTMMFEIGNTEEQIVETVRGLVRLLTAASVDGGAS